MTKERSGGYTCSDGLGPKTKLEREQRSPRKAPKLWAELKAALRRDVAEFTGHPEVGFFASVTFREPQLEDSIWMDVKQGSDPHTGKTAINVSFNPQKPMVEANIAGNGRAQHFRFEMEADDDGEVWFLHEGKRLTADQVSSLILRPVLIAK